MDTYIQFVNETRSKVTRKEFEAGVKFENGKWIGHPDMIAHVCEGLAKIMRQTFQPIIDKKDQLPKLLAELSYNDKQSTLEFMRIWLLRKEPITPLYDKIIKAVMKFNHKHEAFLKKCSSLPLPLPYESNTSSLDEQIDEAYQHAKRNLPLYEKFQLNLADLTHSDPKAAIRILRDWGQGRKAEFQLWEEATEALERGE